MIHITDFNGDIVDFISKSDGAVTEAEHMINVADKLETFDFTILTERTEHMQKRNRVVIEDKDGQYREFIIYNISSDLNGYTRVQTNASALEDIKTAKPVAPNKLEKYTVKQALEYALADTGWEVADDSEWGGTRTTSWTGWHDRISILKQFETTYDMRLSFRVEVGSNEVVRRLVSLKKVEPLFNGEEITYGDNMLDLKRTVDFSDIATALICLGPEDSETGKREVVEVKDDNAQAQFGLPYRYIWDIYEPESNDQNMTRRRLTTLGRTALNKRKESTVSYDIKGINLSASAGDMIRVKNEDFTPELYVDAEVVEVTTDLLSGETDYKFGVIKEYTRADVYARFYAMLDTLRERLNNVVSNTDSIISERLESELANFERYIHKSNVPPLEPKDGDLWLDTSHGGVAVLKRYENGEWIKSSVSDVREIGGMTREETLYENLKFRYNRNELDFNGAFERYTALTEREHFEYLNVDVKEHIKSAMNALNRRFNSFKDTYHEINPERPTIGLITESIKRAIEFEEALRQFNDSYIKARESYDEYIRILQSQYSDEKYEELLNEVADSIGGVIDSNGNIDVSEENKRRLDEAMNLVAKAIGGVWNGQILTADLPHKEDLSELNKSLRAYLNGEINTLDDKLGKQIETVVNQAKNEFSVAINSVEKKVDGIEVGGRNLLENTDMCSSGIRHITSFNSNLASKLKPDTEYTFSVDVKITRSTYTANYIIGYLRVYYTDNTFTNMILRTPQRSLYTDADTRVSETFKLLDKPISRVSINYYGTSATLGSSQQFCNPKLEEGNIATAWSPAPEDYEQAIFNLTQEVTKNTASLNVLDNKISLKADTQHVKQMLDDELHVVKSNVQTNKAELEILSNQITSKVDSVQYARDKAGIINDIKTNASDIKQTADTFSSKINSVNTKLDNQTRTVSSNKSAIEQLNNQISLKADTSHVKQLLDNELKVVKSSIQTSQAQLQLLSNEINSKVSESKYTSDLNGITRDINSTKSEVKQLSDNFNVKVTGLEQKFDDLKVGGRNLVLNSNKLVNTPNYLISTYTLSRPMEVGKTYTLTVKGHVENNTSTSSGLAILRDFGRYFIATNTPKISDDLYQVTFVANSSTYETTNIRLYNLPSSSRVNARIDWIQLEEGNVSTDWSPAPEDFTAEIKKQEDILKKYEADLNVAKDSISQRVSYQEINQTNKTLERVISELTVDTRGINYTYDHNGLLQGFYLNRNYFKLNHNLIDINDGDVVIKDGRTTIKDAYVHKLTSDDAFINNLKAIDIDFNRATAYAQNGTEFIKISGSLLELGGRYLWNWRDYSKYYNSRIVFEKGYMRVTDTDINQHLYYTQKGISTFNDGNLNESSGTLEFFSYDYHNIRKGVTLSSTGGAVALRSALERVILDGQDDVYLMSTKKRVKIQPRKELSGNNTFEFHIIDNEGVALQDGVIYYGSENNSYASAGIRFSKELNKNTVYIVNGSGQRGTGDLELRDLRVNGTVKGTVNLDHINTGDIIFGSLITNNTSTNTYIVVGSAALRITNNKFYNGGNTIYRPIQASSFNPSSYHRYKNDITEWNYDVLEVIKNEFQAYQYRLYDNDRLQRGVIVGGGYQTIPEFINEDSVDLYEMTTWSLRGVQQLAHENDKLKSRIERLERLINES